MTASALEFVRSAFANRIRMFGRAFESIRMLLAASLVILAPDIAFGCDLFVSCAAENPKSPLGEPTVIVVTFSTDCPQPMDINLGTRHRGRIGLRLYDETGAILMEVPSLMPLKIDGMDTPVRRLRPNAAQEDYLVLENWLRFPGPGVYSVEVCVAPFGGKQHWASARIEKSPQDIASESARLRAIAQELSKRSDLRSTSALLLAENLANFQTPSVYEQMAQVLRYPYLGLEQLLMIRIFARRARAGDGEARKVLESFAASCTGVNQAYPKEQVERGLKVGSWAASDWSEAELAVGRTGYPDARMRAFEPQLRVPPSVALAPPTPTPNMQCTPNAAPSANVPPDRTENSLPPAETPSSGSTNATTPTPIAGDSAPPATPDRPDGPRAPPPPAPAARGETLAFLAPGVLLATLLVFIIWLARRRGRGRSGRSPPPSSSTSPPPAPSSPPAPPPRLHDSGVS